MQVFTVYVLAIYPQWLLFLLTFLQACCELKRQSILSGGIILRCYEIIMSSRLSVAISSNTGKTLSLYLLAPFIWSLHMSLSDNWPWKEDIKFMTLSTDLEKDKKKIKCCRHQGPESSWWANTKFIILYLGEGERESERQTDRERELFFHSFCDPMGSLISLLNAMTGSNTWSMLHHYHL